MVLEDIVDQPIEEEIEGGTTTAITPKQIVTPTLNQQ